MPETLCKSSQLRRIAPSALGLLQQIFRACFLFITQQRTKTTLHPMKAQRGRHGSDAFLNHEFSSLTYVLSQTVQLHAIEFFQA